MTTPKINTIQRGGSRLYVHPDSSEKVPGVTSVLNMLPKGFLKFWASKVTAEKAVEHLGEIVSIAMRDPDAAIDFLKRAPDRFTKNAAVKGTDVHDIYERLARGEEIARVHPDLQPYVDVYHGFVTQYEPEFLFLEGTVWSETHGYAGSFDFIAWITDPDTGERVLVIGDWKTTRSGVHEEVALQLTAYKNADYIITPEGEKVDIPPVEAGIVVHAANADKNDPNSPVVGQVVPARIDDDLFAIFLSLLEIWKYDREVKSTTLGRPVPIVVPEKPKRGRR